MISLDNQNKKRVNILAAYKRGGKKAIWCITQFHAPIDIYFAQKKVDLCMSLSQVFDRI